MTNILSLFSVEKCQELAASLGAILVNAYFTMEAEFDNVKISVPSSGDKYFKSIAAHKILLVNQEDVNNLQVTPIADHFSRGDFVEKELLRRNFFIQSESVGKNILAKIKIWSKHDSFRNKQTIVIDIIEIKNDDKTLKAEHILKIGGDAKKPEVNAYEIPIPNTQKFVRVEHLS